MTAIWLDKDAILSWLRAEAHRLILARATLVVLRADPAPASVAQNLHLRLSVLAGLVDDFCVHSSL